MVMPQASILDKEWSADLEQQILRAIKAVRYGSVEIIIHDSQVVQIERKEKIRLTGGKTKQEK
jgi:hypothetical protein